MGRKTYSTRDEAIFREITQPLKEYAADHDIDAIADAVIGSETTSAGVVYFCTVDPMRFWKIVESNPYVG